MQIKIEVFTDTGAVHRTQLGQAQLKPDSPQQHRHAQLLVPEDEMAS